MAAVILLITHSNDISADLVIRQLLAQNANYLRLNTDLLGTPSCFFGFGSEPELNIGSRTIRASDVSAIWVRRFALPATLSNLPKEYAEFVKRELSAVMDAFLHDARSAFFVNKLEADRLAENRLIQANRAQRSGFRVPRTIVTQDEQNARAFLQLESDVVAKAISFGRVSFSEATDTVAFSSVVPSDVNLDGLSCAPALLQEMIQKQAEWRVTTVGDQIFAAKLEKSNTIDWRSDRQNAFNFTPADLPKNVEEMLLNLCSASNIVYGAHDLIESPDGEFVFLETNPAGQWGWLELTCDLPIGKAIAMQLVSGGK